MNKILAWKFTQADGRGAHGTMPFEPGYIYTTDEEIIKPCCAGIHASAHPFDALKYAPGPRIMRVMLWGEVVENGSPVDKLAARNCEVLWARDISRELRLFAVWCARRVEHLMTDDRSKRALDVAEQYARGEATDEELAAAWAAAWDAARDAAWDAAWDAARAAARDAAWDAARNAAWDAARAAARDAAWDAARAAARDAAWAAARDAAWTAAWDAQRSEFLRICEEIAREEESK